MLMKAENSTGTKPVNIEMSTQESIRELIDKLDEFRGNTEAKITDIANRVFEINEQILTDADKEKEPEAVKEIYPKYIKQGFKAKFISPNKKAKNRKISQEIKDLEQLVKNKNLKEQKILDIISEITEITKFSSQAEFNNHVVLGINLASIQECIEQLKNKLHETNEYNISLEFDSPISRLMNVLKQTTAKANSLSNGQGLIGTCDIARIYSQLYIKQLILKDSSKLPSSKLSSLV